MKLAAVVLTTAIAVTVQMALARYTVGDRWVFDIVLVGVVFAALNWGAVAGMLAGSAGGLVQDLLSNEVVGTGGLVKTVIGFAVGTVAAQFVVARPLARVALLVGASMLHRLMLVGVHALIDQRWSALSAGAFFSETMLNAVCGLVVFQLSEALPGLAARGRQARRTGISRREW